MPAVLEVQERLTPHSLTFPDLEMLRPTEARYKCVLLQPAGPIYATASRIGNLSVGASNNARKFLELAHIRGAHLAVTPEYYMPWATLQQALITGLAPDTSSLWILGCESITPAQLLAFKGAVAPGCLVDHEPLSNLSEHGALLDPVVLLFQARTGNGGNQLFALVQFKTMPSRDDVFFEESVLKRGTTIYRFRGTSGHLSVACVICSDAFALSDQLTSSLIDRSTLVHIQLNPDPRHSAYRAYRTKAFSTDPKASDCHIVCLNWAQSIVQHGDGTVQPKEWNNIAGSAWYCSADGCSAADGIVVPNHLMGLYYTSLRKERRHALLFNYDEAVFELLVPKLLTIGPAVLANRNGPSVIRRYAWLYQQQDWVATTVPVEAGWSALLQANPEAKSALASVVGGQDAIGIERALALTAGSISGTDDWHATSEIDSCWMDADEVVCRITFAQDTAKKASDFRHARLMRSADLGHIIATNTDWPAQVAGLNNQAQISWTATDPNFNVLTVDGRPTLVVHLGDSPPPQHIADVPAMLTRLLDRSGSPHRKRVCIVYRKFGQLKFAPMPSLTRFDDGVTDAADIAGAQVVRDNEGLNA